MVLGENRPERKGQSDRRKQEVKGVKRVVKTRMKVRKDDKIGRIRREEREREHEFSILFSIQFLMCW